MAGRWRDQRSWRRLAWAVVFEPTMAAHEKPERTKGTSAKLVQGGSGTFKLLEEAMKVRRLASISWGRLRLRFSLIRIVAAASVLFLCASAAQAQDPQLVPILQGLLHKYKGCILERYETQQDMINRRMDPQLSGLSSTAGLQSRDLGVL